MPARFGLSNVLGDGKVHRALALETGETAAVQDRAMSQRYISVDPANLMGAFERSGFRTVLFEKGMGLYGRSRRHSQLKSWNKILQVVENNPSIPESRSAMRILFNHEGRRSILFQPGLVYVACENAFMAPCHRIRHDDQDGVGEFLEDPGAFVRRIFEGLNEVHNRRTSLNMVGDGYALLRVLAPNHWRTYKDSRMWFDGRYGQETRCFRAALDAVTNVHSVKAEKFAQHCLSDQVYPHLREGRIPDGLHLEFADKDNLQRLKGACERSYSPEAVTAS